MLDPGAGTKQVGYKGGHLLMAWSTAVNWSGDTATRDGVYWLDVVPQLTTKAAHNPQQVNGVLVSNQGIFGYVGGYTYMPTLEASSELDETLVFNYSSATVYPSIVYTGRRQTDAPSTMGQTGASANIVAGTNANGSGHWGDYSACSLTINSVTRGIIWCGGEYGGSQASPTGAGWNTRIYALRTELLSAPSAPLAQLSLSPVSVHYARCRRDHTAARRTSHRAAVLVWGHS